MNLDGRLGVRGFSTFAVWAAAVVWTAAYSEGAGFGAFAYVCAETHAFVYSATCTLVPHPMFPPGVSLGTFLSNAATVWAPGFYDSGILVGFVLTIAVLVAACFMRRSLVERVFSWPVVLVVAIALCVAGYQVEVRQTLAQGFPHVPPL